MNTWWRWRESNPRPVVELKGRLPLQFFLRYFFAIKKKQKATKKENLIDTKIYSSNIQKEYIFEAYKHFFISYAQKYKKDIWSISSLIKTRKADKWFMQNFC